MILENRGEIDRLRGVLRGIDVDPSDTQISALLSLAGLVERWGARINLTGHRGLEGILQGLVVESVALCGVLPEVSSLVDLGSGAGFPGLPIAILRPQCRVRLVDARRRRHHFQKEAVRTLGLDNVDLELGRAEEVSSGPHVAVIAQAPPAEVLPIMFRWAEPGGILVVPTSHPSPEIPEIEGIIQDRVVTYRVPGRSDLRSLWIAHRDCGT
jgi:16S rRNA (guanine527-N7)-methyltransferase